jgi:hypothetical protein
VDACDAKEIPIMAQTVRHLVDEYRGSQQRTDGAAVQLTVEITKYSTAAFVDAITEWLIASDLVRLIC